MLRRWWTKKYQLPWTPKYIEGLTKFDLVVEFYEDLFDDDKGALLEASRGEDGEIMFESTGDPLIDKWERELAMGIDPDLNEGLGTQARRTLEQEKSKISRAKKVASKIVDINDNFDKHMLLGGSED